MLQTRPDAANRCMRAFALGGASTAPCLRAAAAARDRLLAENEMNARSGMPCCAGHSRRPRTVGRSRSLAYATLPIASASSAACRRVLKLCCAPRRVRMPVSGCGPSPQTRVRNSYRWTCQSPSGGACHCPWQRLGVRTWRARLQEPWLTSWETTAPPVPAVGCWPGELPCSSEHGFALRGKPSPLKDGLFPSSG